MKIAACVNHYEPSIGGAEFVAKTIVEYLAQFHSVTVFTRRLARRRDPRDFDYKIVEYKVGDIVGFEAQIKALQPDVMFIYSDVFDFFRQISVKRQPYKLIVALCGANWLHAHRNYVSILYRSIPHVHALVCHSKHERDYRLCSTDRLKEKTVIIPNGVWTGEFDKNTLTRQELAPDIAEKRWILNVSNFFPGKGQEHLIKIIEQLPDPEQTAYIQVSSDINFAIGKQLEAQWRAATLKLKDQGIVVKMMKNMDREEVVGFFKQSNVFAFTSEKEVAPLVLLEAMAASLPWIATNVGNAENLKGGITVACMKDSRYRSVFNRRTYSCFSENIPVLWNNPSLGEEGRQQIDKELNWDNILPQYKSLIEG
ncbi:MAG: glycosyltransferase family 4 protein [Promethearchaeota archaeon]